MAARGIASVNPQRNSQGFIKALASAVLEWLLIFVLLIDGIFSYLITKFSRYCNLQTPCLLCSRLDHVWGNEKLGYYWDLICGNHKLEISSLVLCHAHNKLVDGHAMCESCLFSFATINKSNAETYRLLVGKLGEDSSCGVDQVPLLEGHELDYSTARHCSCCNEQWSARGYTQNLMATKLNRPEAAELDLPLSVAVGHNQDDEGKRRDSIPVSVRTTHSRNGGPRPMPHVGYTELKITSDTESEFLCSDDDDYTSSLVHESNDPKEDVMVQYVQLEPRITLADDSASEKLIDPASAPEASLLVSQVQSDVIKRHGGTSASTAVIEHGLEELNWQQVEFNINPPAPIELISLGDVPPSSNVVGSPFEVSKESLDVPIISQVREISVTESGDVCKSGRGPRATTELGSEANPASIETGKQVPNSLDLGDAYKIAVGNRGRQLSDVLAEQWTGKDSSKVSEDLKLLLSQLSAARSLELSMNDMSPRVSGNIDELKTFDASGSTGLHILQKRISLERNESGLSLDGSIVSEIEGENAVDRLKRQIDYDRKAMGSLYKELEEERNASAIAANQAMAMITRLQEEKAALHMDALQYLRMMEEQAEYDMEALQKSNDIIAEKEKVVQALGAELEFYRKKFPNESMAENVVEPSCNLRVKDIEVEQSAASIVEDSASAPRYSFTEDPNICDKVEGIDMSIGDKNIGSVNNSLLEFEDERLYILKCLNKLEKKLNLFSNNGVCPHLANREYTEDNEDGVSELKELDCEGKSKGTSVTKENDLSTQNDISGRSLHTEERHDFSTEGLYNAGKEISELDYGGEDSPMASGGTDLVSLGNEVHYLNDRLKTLEADQNFLERAINSLRNGKEGLQFIEEIASHLRELRRIGIIQRDQTAA